MLWMHHAMLLTSFFCCALVPCFTRCRDNLRASLGLECLLQPEAEKSPLHRCIRDCRRRHGSSCQLLCKPVSMSVVGDPNVTGVKHQFSAVTLMRIFWSGRLINGSSWRPKLHFECCSPNPSANNRHQRSEDVDRNPCRFRRYS